MKKFEVNQKYFASSPCDHNCIWTFRVIKRTEKTVLLKNEYGDLKRCKIHEFKDEEYCYPLGSYSMCPVLSAGKEI